MLIFSIVVSEWCEKVLESEMFYAMKRELDKEFPLIAA
ncbi:hypothetical protein SGB_01221 [Shigella boydii ATCC 9905]|nr:hypothetical protein SGB_01221 [Shigella boydii ATCC 9905]